MTSRGARDQPPDPSGAPLVASAGCPADSELLLFLDGLLPPDRRDDVHAHLDTCSNCRRVLGVAGRSESPAVDQSSDLAGRRSTRSLLGEGLAATRIDEFELIRRLGYGGMGEVWLARDTLLERDVAIKLGRRPMTEEARSRSLIEARAVARLRHPNIVAVHHVGELEDQLFLVTELLEGRSLDSVGRLPPAEVVAIGLDLARGLAAAHAAGVLHRDVKPANAFLCQDGTAKLLDFGLAKLADDPTAATTAGAMDLEIGSAGVAGTLPATAPSAIMGTPLYMAPETWEGRAATRATDVYLFGGLLFTLLAGRAPLVGTSAPALRAAALAGRIPDPAELAPDAPLPLADVIRRCLSLDPDLRPSAEAVCHVLQALAAPAEASFAGDEDPMENPYRGLLSFGAEHRRLFFGREAETAAVLTQLSAAPFVLVVGQSGAGKSSLVRAGVVPRVLSGALGSGQWQVATVVPGDRPMEHLAQALGPYLGETEGEVLRHLGASPSSWVDEIVERARTKRLLLVVDQFEEAWTLARPESRATFVDALSALAGVGREVRVVATLRLDFLERIGDLGELGALALRAPVVLGPLSSEGLRRAIEEPARRCGVEIDPALTDALVDRARGAVGMLPLLEFALGVLWARRGEGATRISLGDLEILGGLEGALAVHADGTLGRLEPRIRAEARRILLSLVTVERTRARREEAELAGASADAQAALAALVDARLVVATAGDEATAYEVAHEVLVSGWPTLRRWLDEESDARHILERLRRAVVEWERLGRAESALWSERQLGELTVLRGRDLPEDAARFVAESRAAVLRARLRRWALRAGAPLAALSVLVGVAGAVRWRERRETRAFVAAQTAEAEAAEREVRDLSAEVEVARAAAFARFDADDRTGGEARWKEALRLAGRASDAFARASAPLGRALARDPLDAGTRARAADLTYLWLLAAERDHDATLARDLSARLAVLDDDGSRRARLAAPAHLSVTVGDGVSASVVLHAVHANAEGHRVEDAGRPITLGASMELPPGSYILAATAPGRYPTRLPVLLGSADTQAIEIPLPASADVPPGFVFVPAGASLLGSADVEWLRGASTIEPEHAVEVEAFLIGVHEVTFAEYLEFLASLPAAERALRRPHATNLDLGYGPDGAPILTLGKVTARRGEPFCRPKRSERRCQDWLRFPVAGVSVEDAQAYVEWLARGRLLGARRCTEREWERAARGADNRLYAHGDASRPGDANFDETYRFDADMMGADEVGSFPADRSPFGVLDLGGNVREWVSQKGSRMARGGDWLGAAVDTRAAYRNIPPDDRGDYVGLRVCASVPRTRPSFR